MTIVDPRLGDAGRIALSVLPERRGVPGPAALRVARPGPMRDLCVTLLGRSRRDWRAASNTVAEGIRQARFLHSRERRFVADHLHALIRWEDLLTLVLRRAGAGILSGARGDLARHLAALVLPGWLSAADARALWDGPPLDWELIAEPERLVHAWIIDERPDPVAAIGAAASFPTWLVAELAEAHGADEAGTMLAALNRRAVLTLRANRLRGDREDLRERLLARGVASHPGRWGQDSLHLDDHIDVGSLPEFQDGRCEVQDEGSQLITQLVGAEPGMLVVDACAGAGGKSLALAAVMENRGRVLAADVRSAALGEASRRARRAGARNVETVAVAAEGPLPPALWGLRGRADRLLVDAPCSGTGALRRHPEARWHLSPLDTRAKPREQLTILERWAPLLAPGGRLVYATCALGHRENDEVVAAFLSAHPDWRPVPSAETLGPLATELGGEALRLLPHRHGTDGFFATILARREPALPGNVED